VAAFPLLAVEMLPVKLLLPTADPPTPLVTAELEGLSSLWPIFQLCCCFGNPKLKNSS
jgi:hypothetical protein